MHILTGAVVSAALLSVLFLMAYKDDTRRAWVVDVCAAMLAVCLMTGCLLAGYWTAALLGKL